MSAGGVVTQEVRLGRAEADVDPPVSLTRAEQQLALLQSIIAVWADATTLQEATPRILESICDSVGWDFGAIWIVDRDAHVLRSTETFAHIPLPHFAAHTRALTLRRGEGLGGRVWQTAEPHWITDVCTDDNFPRRAAAEQDGLHGGMAFPILLRGDVLGLIEFFTREVRPPDDTLLEMVATIGNQIGLFIERKRVEDDLRQSEQRYRTLAEGSPLVVWSVRPGGYVDYLNQRWFDYTGRSRKEAYGRGWESSVHPDDLEQFLGRRRGQIATEDSFETEVRLRRADGVYRWHLASIIAVRQPDGAVRSWLGTGVDIDDRKRLLAGQRFLADATAVLASSLDYETTLRNVTNLAVPAVADLCSVDMLQDDGSLRRVALTHVDKQLEARLNGMDPTFNPEPEGQQPARRILRSGQPELIAEVTDRDLEPVARDGDHLALLRALGVRSAMMVPLAGAEHRYGTVLFVSTESGRRYDSDDLRVAEELARRAAVAIDHAKLYSATQKALAEKEESDERFRLAASAARMGTWEWDLGEKVVWSEALEAIYGYPPGSYPGTFDSYTERIHPDDREQVQVSISAALADGDEFEVEHRVVTPDGTTRWVVGRGRAFFGIDRKPIRMMGIALDITERKLAELRLQETMEELRRASDAKDEFLGLVSHELKTPITTILGNAEVLQRRADELDDESRTGAYADIHDEADRLHRIIDNLLVLARLEQGGQLEREPLLVRRLVERIVHEHQRRHPYRPINVRAEVGPTPIVAEPSYIEQVLRNLLSNAEKYSAPTMAIDVVIARTGDELELAVLDRGSGFPEDEADRLFTPFYRSPTAAMRADGVGIGLAVCKRLIEALGGRVWARRRDGGGADIGFALPAVIDSDA